jgi:aromatic ring hydroxylase
MVIAYSVFILFLLVFVPWISLFVYAEYKDKFNWNK